MIDFYPVLCLHQKLFNLNTNTSFEYGNIMMKKFFLYQ
ncbi:hypothetical protein COO91_07276 [Nostoc flagelliforme CCNUN1]|uniref:Uncharacterized protein n=1 Tax=Nostoc flagelliforme CCNUN1 TaxID=2038116 RepID=A0A2K8T0M6_9NOSO|nr:hypothetical protein COO91_07276 [Nostoc flagelliforme CCNUN1]